MTDILLVVSPDMIDDVIAAHARGLCRVDLKSEFFSDGRIAVIEKELRLGGSFREAIDKLLLVVFRHANFPTSDELKLGTILLPAPVRAAHKELAVALNWAAREYGVNIVEVPYNGSAMAA